jgi:acyl-CoA reductase-like NAD-dependent aldehyde dehydrogenase
MTQGGVLMKTIETRHLIDGAWDGTPTRERTNPARPDDVVSIAAVADAAVVDRAIAGADRARAGWAATPAPERGGILLRAAEVLEGRLTDVATDLTREEGKTLQEATGEVRRAAAILRFFGSEGWRIGGQTYPSATRDVLIYGRREPMGIVLAVTPWNFPIAIPAWKIAPALIAGNAVILKPAGQTPATAAHLVAALVDAGIPNGVLGLVLGSGAEIGDRLVDDPRVAAITFTGSVRVGSGLYERAAPRRARVQLEMGGKNAIVVLDDADPDEAARIVATGGFGLTGQACTATSRVICQRGIAPRFVDALVEESRRFAPGDGLDPAVLMGPVISPDQLSIDRSFVEDALAEGLRVVAGGEPPEALFHAPTVIAGVEPGHALAQEEIFGPVVAVIEVASLDEAIAVVNGTRYGLAAGIVTANLGAAQRFARDARVGVVKINQPTSGVEPNVPFGGVGDSSTNTYREQGSAAIDFFTWMKSVYMTPPSWG